MELQFRDGGNCRDKRVAAEPNHSEGHSAGSSLLGMFRLKATKPLGLRNNQTGDHASIHAVASTPPARQTLRYERPQLEPRLPEDTSSEKFHPYHPTTSAPLSPDSVCALPRRPENAVIKPLRVPPTPQSNSISPCVTTLHECCNNITGVHWQTQVPIMGLSKTQRISILLAIDGVFFFIELIAGYAVHSLALVADSFHMLNDVLSLCVGLWAVKRAKTGRTTMYTYGWQRAETLGALVNGVFLVALCLSIFLEAIQRFVEPQIVTNPVLVLIVGCLGLASNILGLFLFHDHGHGGHSHGEEEHTHEHSHSHDPIRSAEEGHTHSTQHVQWSEETRRLISNEEGNVEDVLPSVRVAGFEGSPAQRGFTKSDESNTTTSVPDSPSAYKRRSASTPDKHRRRSSFFTGSIDDMPIHPAGRRGEIIQASHYDEDQSDEGTDEALDQGEEEPLNHSSSHSKHNGYGSIQPDGGREYSHAAHKHRQPRDAQTGGGGGHGHSHGDLNMRGVFLHVLGDALGNVGVIVTALIIWLTTFEGRYYFDPAVSLIITVIILYSAIPLCKAAARILLQAVPMGMSIDEIKADIEDLEGVESAHHIHVWQLSDTRLVASLHVRISSEIKNPGSEGYMHLAREIQQCLKEWGIRSSTIQPEFECAIEPESGGQSANGSTSQIPKSVAHKTSSLHSRESAKVCMLDSEDAGEVLERQKTSHEHSHDHDHDHDSHSHSNVQKNGKQKHNHQH